MKSRRARIVAVGMFSAAIVVGAMVVKAIGFGLDAIFPLVIGVSAALVGAVLVLPAAFRVRRAIHGDEDRD